VTITSTRYEEVAQILLDRFANDFGLPSVEGKQDMPGNLTGTSWEIDAKGVVEGSDASLIVECRRYTTPSQFALQRQLRCVSRSIRKVR
jgi:hypothetical protein